MTHPTKAIYKWLIQDSVRVQYVPTFSLIESSLTLTKEPLILLRPENDPIH